MKTTNVIATIALFLASANGLATSARRAEATTGKLVPEGYAIADLEWELETTPGGSKVALTGTVEEVHAKILEINPKWDEEFAPIVAEENAKADLQTRAVGDNTNKLRKRNWTVCGGYPARQNRIREGISYLRGLSGQASRGPGPRNCVRVSCSYNSAIWYCNDNSFTKEMPWFHIANAAQVLVDQCSWEAHFGTGTAGERWHDDRWFAIVGEEGC
ncbi:hypothetical protein QBC44DRAFT_370938 [Cladorrhinum sp. PSN332]|nr:hypothetical protein QBC44DRAFT_370938 [Cladorrhinum sp. PSN332]